jgi:ABC-type multidrug transport system fused ATPase/permease subunit
MIRLALIFIIGITLALVAIYDWRVALRITIPIALIIASLIGLDIYQTNHQNQQMVTQDHQNRMQENAVHNAPAGVDTRVDKAEMELQRIEQAEKVRRVAEERMTAIKAFFNNNRSLVEDYFNSASRCHAALTFTGKMEDDAHCQAAIEAKHKLQAITERSLAGISKEELKKEDSTTMWRIEYADNQMDSAYQRSKYRK